MSADHLGEVWRESWGGEDSLYLVVRSSDFLLTLLDLEEGSLRHVSQVQMSVDPAWVKVTL